MINLEQLEHKLLRNRLVTDNNCWEWLKSKDSQGYGYIRLDKKLYKVHRASAHVWLGLAENSDLYVLHKCDNPSCFNPDHLFLGTCSDNYRDARNKGRPTGRRGYVQGYFRCGHPYTTENIVPQHSGTTLCRICKNKRSREARERKLA